MQVSRILCSLNELQAWISILGALNTINYTFISR